MKNRYLYISGIVILLLIIIYIAYNLFRNDIKIPEYSGEMNTEVVSKYNPNETYDLKSLDSLDFVTKITTQKLQEVLDLASVSYNNKDLKIKEILSNQLNSYFFIKDSLSLSYIYNNLLEKHNYLAKISEVQILKNDSVTSDTLGRVNFTYHLFDKENSNKYIITKTNSASYVLKKNPEKLKNQFKYYFTSFGEKDTIRQGVTK